MVGSELRKAQFVMADFLRNPQSASAPKGIEPRRLRIYQDLVYNNIEGFISGGFPVLRSLYTDSSWHELVEQFIEGHRCHTPYFLEISQEFLRFLTQEYQLTDNDPPFIAELAHYEWVELALDVSVEELSSERILQNALIEIPVLSPLAWLLSYQFPVHRVGPDYQPSEVTEPTFLVVYRSMEDDIGFMEMNPATARLLELLRDNTGSTGTMLLHALANELDLPEEAAMSFGGELLGQFVERSIICAS